MNGKYVKSLIDTGSTRTIVKYDNQLGVENSSCRLIDAVGAEIKVQGSATVTVSNGNNSVEIKALVVEKDASFPGKLILGTDLLNNADAIIDFNTRTVRLWPSELGAGSDSLCVHNTREIHLGPWENVIFDTDHESPDKCCFVESNQIMRGRGMIASSYSSGGKIPISAINALGVVTSIPAGTMLAKAYEGARPVEKSTEVNVSMERDSERGATADAPTNNVTKIAAAMSEPRQITAEDICTDEHGKLKHDLVKLLNQHRKAIALPGEPLGRTNLHVHDIKLTDPNAVIYQRQYRISYKYQEELDEVVDKMLQDGVIAPSLSPFNIPVVVVEKSDKTLRMCLNFRKLNEITIPARYPMPIIADLLNQLRDGRIFSTLDLMSAFNQVPLTKEASEKTAFTTRSGHYEYKSLAFGHIDSPSIMCKVIATALAGAIGVCVYSRNEAEHIKHLNKCSRY